MTFPNYTSVFSGSAPKPALAGNLASLVSGYKDFRDALGGDLDDKNFLPFAIFMQQANAERMSDPANITRQLEAMEAPLGRMAQQAAKIQEQKDMRSLVGNLVARLPDTFNQALGAKFAYDQPVFQSLGSPLAPNPYAYGVLNRGRA